MMRSLFAGVSGLKVHQTKMDVIGNNIANVNTAGYKKSRVNFQEMLNQTIRGASSPQNGVKGGINPTQIGLGVSLGSIDVIHTPGSPQSTGKALDMSVEGEGYFIVGNGANKLYTRAGNFDFDSGNNLVTTNGYYVQGWTADSDTFELNTGDTSQIQNISLGNLASKTINRATENIEIGKNLDSRIPAQTATTTYTSQINSTQIGAIDPNDPSTYVTIQLPQGAVFDQNFSIGSIGYNELMADQTKWDYNPTTGELLLKDSDFTIDEVQNIDLDGSTSGQFQLKLTTTSGGTQTTDPISLGVTPADTAANIETELNKLNLGTGGSISVSEDGSGGFNVDFTGGDVGGSDLAAMNIVSSTLNGTSPQVIEVTAGSNATLTQDPEINFHKADHQTPITIFDSQGNSHEASVVYYKSTDNKWLANLVIDGEMVQLKSSPSVPANTEFLHEIEFNEDGQIINGANLDFKFSNGTTFGNSVDPLDVRIDLSGLTQVALSTTALGLSQDGFEPGSLENISVDTAGKIVGTYSNGQNLDLAQVAISTFRNPGGLTKTGNTLFSESKNSGDPQMGVPGVDGKGVIKPETLEMSNVDLSQEFVDMITTQRGFQANSRIITTSDEMLQELVNLRR